MRKIQAQDPERKEAWQVQGIEQGQWGWKQEAEGGLFQ